MKERDSYETQIEELKKILEKSTDEKNYMRRGFSKELSAYKEQNLDLLNKQIAKYVKK